jgi:hypothetical protein
MNGPEDEVSLLDQTGACLCQSLEKRIEARSTPYIARPAHSRYAAGGLTRKAPGTIISRADA